MLKIGVLLDASTQEAWLLDALQRVLGTPDVTISCVIDATNPDRQRVSRWPHRLLDALDHTARSRGEPLFRQVDIATKLQLPSTTITVQASQHHWVFGSVACQQLRQQAVDLWLCAGRLPPELAEADVSRLGVWGLEIGDGVPLGNPLAGAAEIAADCPVTMITVLDYSRSAAGRPLLRVFGATEWNSVRRNRLNAVRKACGLWQRLLQQPDRQRATPEPVPQGYPGSLSGQRGLTVRLLLALARQIARNRWRNLFWRRQWQIAYRFDPDPDDRWSGSGMRYLVPPADRFWADPFALVHNGRYFIFFEELHYSDWQGRIMAVEVFPDRAPGEPRLVLECDWHLSYPFVFQWNDDLYMIPESAESGRVELYRCHRFPDDWRLERVLLEGMQAYDATLWRRGDRWWMFVSIAPPGLSDGDELHLFHSDSPLGPWQAHAANPVISDARRARPAGPLYERDGVLYRPSQDCSREYGYAVVINRVDQLTESEYRETTVDRVTASFCRPATCLHTVGQGGRLQVLDYQLWRRRF
jgi:hypothetical protein